MGEVRDGRSNGPLNGYQDRRNAYMLHLNTCNDCQQSVVTACWPENCHWYRAIDALCPVGIKFLQDLNDTIK